MPKARDPKIIEAIEMVANGVSPRQAWEQCGMPNGEHGIQNIRKGGRELKAQRAAQQEEVVVAEPEQGPAGPGKGHPAAGFRLSGRPRDRLGGQRWRGPLETQFSSLCFRFCFFENHNK